MTGQRIAVAAVWPLTAFLYFDSTAVHVHIVLTILHRSTKESYNSYLFILILIQTTGDRKWGSEADRSRKQTTNYERTRGTTNICPDDIAHRKVDQTSTKNGSLSLMESPFRNWKKCDFTLFVWPLGVAIAYVHRARLRTAMLGLRIMSLLINSICFDKLFDVWFALLCMDVLYL